MVQRYEWAGIGDMPESEDGGFVSYEDYAKLETLYAAAIEHMVLVHRSCNVDVSPTVQELYEKASDADEPCN